VVLIKPKIWERHGLKPWIEAARKWLHRNVLAIARASKLARIAWSVPKLASMPRLSSRHDRGHVSIFYVQRLAPAFGARGYDRSGDG
jgi:hypothetical protein